MGIWIRVSSASMVAVLWGSGIGACAQVATPQETAQPVLVELFTSEGCSSCPPADELLRKLAGKRTDTGQLIVALSEHVTYWNRLGWADPFSDEEFTQRQNRYAERFNLESVYTPQAVVNGDRQMAGNDARAIVGAVEAQKGAAAGDLHILKVVATEGAVEVTFSVTGALPTGAASVFGVVADDMDTSTVARGENGGRTLTHVAVARSITRVGEFAVGEPRTVKLATPRREGATAKVGQHVVLFAQAGGQGVVLSIVSAPVAGDFPQTATVGRVH